MSIPNVSIGMPIYNSEKYLRNALDSLLSQTFADFELIISDNASIDSTEAICREYAARDSRIKYIRQRENQGAYANFKFVLDEARGEYFMWAAGDDRRSPDFVEVNFNFLSEHPDYVASTSPNCFEGAELTKQNLIDFKLDGELYGRFTTFFENCWISHGIFYSLVRTSVLRACTVLGQSFIALDWAINLHLASRGKLNRTESGYTVFGVNGVSSTSNAYRIFRNDFVELFIPFYRLSKYVFQLTAGFTLRQKLRIAFILIRLNIFADYDQLRAQLYKIYCKHIRQKIRRG